MRKKIFMLLTVLSVILCLFGAVHAADEGVRIQEQVNKSTVMIESKLGQGTGFFINEKHIVTNHHVVSPYLLDGYLGGEGWWDSAVNTTVRIYYSVLGSDYVNGVVIQDWPEADLAVIEVDPDLVKRVPLRLNYEENVFRGMNIYTVGFPGVNYENIIESNQASIAEGRISNITPSYIPHIKTELSISGNDVYVSESADNKLYQQLVVTTIINPGNSGGPIVDRSGNLVGIANAGIKSGGAIASFGIHVKELSTRLNNAGIKFEYAKSQNGLILWIAVGVLGAAVIAAAVILILKNRKGKDGGGSGKVTPPSGKASVQGLSGQFSGISKPLSREKDTVFGVDGSVCNVVFEKNVRGVSRKHCRIHFSKTHQCFIIQDLESTNGTVLVRGSHQRQVPTNSGLALRNGDLIYIPNKDNSFRVNL